MIEEIREKQKNLKKFDLGNESLAQEQEEILDRCKAFPFRYNNYGRKWVKPFAYIFVFVMIVLSFIFAYTNNPQLLPMFGAGAFILLIIVVVKERQIDMTKKLTQYFQDENGEFYRVIFTQGASIAAGHYTYRSGRRAITLSDVEKKAQMVDRNLEEAQEIYPTFYYVNRYKQGIKDWDPINGGLAKVAHLQNLTLIKQGEKKSLYACEIDGKKKTLKILNAYEGLAEAVEGEV